jgi:carbonic anhydrase/acetyltransferase-like protein (isoleucine patch superfamily)
MSEISLAAPVPCPNLPYSDEGSIWDSLWIRPEIHPTAWVAPGAVIMGRVRLKAKSSVWYGCVLRGDGDFIEVGEETNVQDGSILHVDHGFPCLLGNRVTLGHRAIVHASVVEDGALIGIAATVLSRCHIGEQALIAAGAVVLEGTTIPPKTLWAGCPAKQIKELTEEQLARMAHAYQHYVNNSQLAIARSKIHDDAWKQTQPVDDSA